MSTFPKKSDLLDVGCREVKNLWACELLADLSACRCFCSPMSKSCDRLSAADIAPPGAAIRLFPTHAEQSHVTTVYNSKTLPTGVAGLRYI